jgi:hypothetical protein
LPNQEAEEKCHPDNSKGKGKGNGSGNGNEGISVPTDTKQNLECQTAGGVSLITGSCTALSTNIIANCVAY